MHKQNTKPNSGSHTEGKISGVDLSEDEQLSHNIKRKMQPMSRKALLDGRLEESVVPNMEV